MFVGGSDVSCHVICRDIRSEHAVLDAGVVTRVDVCARGLRGWDRRMNEGRHHRAPHFRDDPPSQPLAGVVVLNGGMKRSFAPCEAS